MMDALPLIWLSLNPEDGSDNCSIIIFDGDSDRSDDDNDANSPAFPPFQTSPITLSQGINPGAPGDDAAEGSPLLQSPSVSFRLNGPPSSPIVVPAPGEPMLNISGDREWELTTIYSTSPLCDPPPANADLTVPEILSGEAYEIEVFGLDARNTIFFNVDKEIRFNTTPTCPVGDLGFESKSDGTRFLAGDVVTTEIPGVTVSTENAGGMPAMIFNSFAPTGGDDDLGSPNEGCSGLAGPGIGAGGLPSNCLAPEGDLPNFLLNVLIISEDGITPDDRAAGGTIVFEFDVLSDIDTVSLLDIEEAGGVIEAFDENDNLLLSQAIPETGDNGFVNVPFIVFGAKTLKVTLAGEGAVAAITFCPEEVPEQCVIILDEDAVDNGTSSIEQAAASHNVEPDWLVNDNNPVEIGNPWLNWNVFFPGDEVVIPSGQTQDEGWFFLPENPPWPIEDFVEGTIPQDQLDKIDNVEPLDNDDLMSLVGKTCIAIVYDSDISINYDNPINGNLQGARYGKFAFTVLGTQGPGTLPESGSSSSLKDMIIRVEGTDIGVPPATCSGDTTGEVRDDFSNQSYTNNDGSRNWSGAWEENDDNGNGASGGNVKVNNGKLRLRRSNSSIEREVDVCASGDVTLSFRYKMSNNVDPDDRVTVEISADGGSTWNFLDEYAGKVGWTTASYSIDSYASDEMRVRFSINDSYNNSGEWFIVNWIKINSN